MNETTAQAELAVIIGRFQPFHLGHLALLEKALALAPRALVVVGSAPGPRMAKNPFSGEERIDSIRQSLTPEQQARVGFATVRDYYDEPRWAGAVKAAVARETTGPVALVGFRKDDSSAYLSLFPEWREHALPRQAPIDGTVLRRLYYESAGAELPPELVAAVPAAVARFLLGFRSSAYFAPLRDELLALDQNRKTYGTGPFVAVDALVTFEGQVLLIERGNAPCKGLWALPGGFLEGSERLLSAAIRELREETRLACTTAELRAAFRSAAVFDHPQRSQRGRTITHAHHFALQASSASGTRHETTPPHVEGADDAQAARWFPCSQLPSMLEELAEDHFQIIDHFLAISRD
jgi:bifunctional NMN adenylyltransferase/nudix hydrolase